MCVKNTLTIFVFTAHSTLAVQVSRNVAFKIIRLLLKAENIHANQMHSLG